MLHALVYGTFILMGLWFTWRGGYRFGDLWPGRANDEEPSDAPPRSG